MFHKALAENVVKTALDQVFDQGFQYEQVPSLARATDPMVFKQDTTDRSAVIIEQFQGVGYFGEKAELQSNPEGSARVGNQIVYSVLDYAKSVDISRNLFNDDQHSTIQKMIKSMGRNAGLTRDKNAFSKFNTGFTTTKTNDGVALFSNSHVTLGGDTVDNLVSGALSESTLNDAFNLLLEQKTQDGTLGGHTPAVLLVPNKLFKTAQEITKSELRSGTADNDLNYYSQIYPGLVVKQSPFLGASQGGSDTAWFLLSNDHSMYRWEREALTTAMVGWEYQRNNDIIYKAVYREMTGPISFEGLVGSTGV